MLLLSLLCTSCLLCSFVFVFYLDIIIALSLVQFKMLVAQTLVQLFVHFALSLVQQKLYLLDFIFKVVYNKNRGDKDGYKI